MGLADIAVLAAIVAVPLAVRLLSRRRTGGRRFGGNCTGCNGCTGCTRCCANCAGLREQGSPHNSQNNG